MTNKGRIKMARKSAGGGKRPANDGKTSELVWLYVKRRPHLKEMLRSGVANYSAMARKVSKEAFGNAKEAGAVRAALARIARKLRKEEGSLEEETLKVLKGSSLTLSTKVAVVISTIPLENEKPVSFAKSGRYFTYIIPEEALNERKNAFGIKSIERNLNLITIHSTDAIEGTPGVIASILNALASEGINVVEFISCYTDTLLVVRQSEAVQAYETLEAMLR
ncbi:MAG: ACT domain-containing protein [Candidatus Bilamarchaeaceae archaeon]